MGNVNRIRIKSEVLRVEHSLLGIRENLWLFLIPKFDSGTDIMIN